jgi:hypothetical protein
VCVELYTTKRICQLFYRLHEKLVVLYNKGLDVKPYTRQVFLMHHFSLAISHDDRGNLGGRMMSQQNHHVLYDVLARILGPQLPNVFAGGCGDLNFD